MDLDGTTTKWENKSKILIILILIKSWVSVQICLDECVDNPSFTGICYEQGDVEFDFCRAQCYRNIFVPYFPCGQMDAQFCKDQCVKADCESHCKSNDIENGFCASDGDIYPSECVMNCRNPELKIWYKCAYPFNAQDCQNRCVHRWEASNYGHQHHNNNFSGYNSNEISNNQIDITLDLTPNTMDHHIVGTSKDGLSN